MRNLIILLSVILFVSGCGNNGSSQKTVTDEAQLAYDNASLSPERIEDIFLGFSFNMTSAEVQTHFDSLYKAGKLSTNSKNAYTYTFNTDQGSLEATFSQEYYNDTLCLFRLAFTTGSGLLSTSELSMQSVIDVFQKQSQGYDFYINETVKASPSYMYIKDNLVVKFSSLSDALMTYINAPKYELLQERKEQETSNKVNSTVSDF